MTQKSTATLSPALIAVFAAASGMVVANIYYAQPLTALISQSLGLHASLNGFVVTLTQLGYGAGLILLVSLADLVENRRLIGMAMIAAALALAAVAYAPSMAIFFAASFGIGFFSVAAQILVPFSAHLAAPEQRGQVVGNVMAGLLAGVMLSRPVSSLLADAFGWRAVFAASAALMVVLAIILRYMLPQRRPVAGMHYGQILASLWTLLRDTPLLRRRAAYQGMLFAAFSLFWTGIPLTLAGSRFGFSQRGIAFFALAGAAGALAAPLAGRLADKGYTRRASGVAMAMVVGALLLTIAAYRVGSVALLVVAAVILDAGVQTNQVLSLRSIYSLPGEARSRLNALFMTSVFLGGAAGSALAGWSFFYGGWPLTAAIGAALGVAALAFYATEFRRQAGGANA